MDWLDSPFLGFYNVTDSNMKLRMKKEHGRLRKHIKRDNVKRLLSRDNYEYQLPKGKKKTFPREISRQFMY